MNKIEGIDKFIMKVRTGSKTGSKEIRMTTLEASDLVAAIAQVLSQNAVLSDEIRDLQKLFGTSLRLDGGKF
jgi:hypothetical protein